MMAEEDLARFLRAFTALEHDVYFYGSCVGEAAYDRVIRMRAQINDAHRLAKENPGESQTNEVVAAFRRRSVPPQFVDGVKEIIGAIKISSVKKRARGLFKSICPIAA